MTLSSPRVDETLPAPASERSLEKPTAPGTAIALAGTRPNAVVFKSSLTPAHRPTMGVIREMLQARLLPTMA